MSADSETDKELVQEFIDSGKGVAPKFSELDEEEKQGVLFPDLLPRFAGSKDSASFDLFHRYGQGAKYWYRDGDTWLSKLVLKMLSGRIEKKGLAFEFYTNWGWLTTLAVALTFATGLIDKLGFFFFDFPNLPVPIIILLFFIIMVLLLFLILYREGVAKHGNAWEQLELSQNTKPRAGHHYWNGLIFDNWKENLKGNIKLKMKINNIECSNQDIEDARYVFISAVLKCDTRGYGLDQRKKPSRALEEMQPSLSRLRMTFIWQSESLTRNYCEFLERWDVAEIDSMNQRDIGVLEYPIFETSEKMARNDILEGIKRLPGLDDYDERIILEQPDFWLERKISTTRNGKKTEVTFSEAVTNFTDDWKNEDKGAIRPFTLSDRAASGKTTILNLLCIGSNARPSGYWPLRVKLKDFSKNITPSESSLLSQIKEAKMDNTPDGLDKDEWLQSLDFFFRNNPIRSQNLPAPLIILDGLDEVQNESREQWRKLIFQEHRIPIIVSTRPAIHGGTQNSYSFSEVTTTQRMRLLEFARVDSRELEGLLDKTLDRLPQSSNNPFMCLMIIGLLLKEESDRRKADLDISLDSLSRNFIRRIIEREFSFKKPLEAMDPGKFALEATEQIGRRLRELDYDDSIINKSEEYALLGKTLQIRDPWLEGHYISRSIEGMSVDAAPAPEVFLKPGEDLDDRDELILRQMISSNPSGIFQWDGFGKRSSFVFSIIAEEWAARSSEDREKYLKSFGLEWGIGDTNPLEEATISRISDRSLETVAGLLHLHCSMTGSSQESLNKWRETVSDRAWEGLLTVALGKIVPMIENKLKSENYKLLASELMANITIKGELKDEKDPEELEFFFDYITSVKSKGGHTSGLVFVHQGSNQSIQRKLSIKGKAFGAYSNVLRWEYECENIDDAVEKCNSGNGGVVQRDLGFDGKFPFGSLRITDSKRLQLGFRGVSKVSPALWDFLEQYLRPWIKLEKDNKSEGKISVQNHYANKPIKHIRFYRGLSNRGPPNELNFLTWVLSEPDGRQEEFEKARSVVESLEITPNWIPVNMTTSRKNRLLETRNGENPAKPIISLISSIIDSRYDERLNHLVSESAVQDQANLTNNTTSEEKDSEELRYKRAATRYGVESLSYLLSLIESLGGRSLSISNEQAATIRQEIFSNESYELTGQTKKVLDTLFLRMLSNSSEENRRIFLQQDDALTRDAKHSGSLVSIEISGKEEIMGYCDDCEKNTCNNGEDCWYLHNHSDGCSFCHCGGEGEGEIKIFSKEGNEISEELESQYGDISKLRFFDCNLDETHILRKSPSGMIVGDSVVIADGTAYSRLSPILIRKNLTDDTEEVAKNLLPATTDGSAFTSIVQASWGRNSTFPEARALINGKPNTRLIRHLRITDKSLIRSPRISRLPTNCLVGNCNSAKSSPCRYGTTCPNENCEACHCVIKPHLFIVEAMPSPQARDEDIASSAILLTNPAKSLLTNTPSQNSELARVVSLFNSKHTIESHRNAGNELKNISEKCYAYLQYDTQSSWRQPHYGLVMPGLHERAIVFPASQDDPVAESVSSGFSRFFQRYIDSDTGGGDGLDDASEASSDPATDPLSQAMGRWYLCNFEVKRTINGYELIMPVPDSIELLCQKCLGSTISEPIQDGIEPLFICPSCHSSEEE